MVGRLSAGQGAARQARSTAHATQTQCPASTDFGGRAGARTAGECVAYDSLARRNPGKTVLAFRARAGASGRLQQSARSRMAADRMADGRSRTLALLAVELAREPVFQRIG